jgi:hypothetical protein
MNISVQISVQVLASVLLVKYSEIRLLDHRVILLNILRNCHIVFHRSCTILHFQEQCAWLQVLHILANIFKNNFPHYVFSVVVHYSLDLYLSSDCTRCTSFHVIYVICITSLQKHLFKSLPLFELSCLVF